MALDGYYEGPGKDVMALAPALGGAFDTYPNGCARPIAAAGT
jgi:hypothetical protein